MDIKDAMRKMVIAELSLTDAAANGDKEGVEYYVRLARELDQQVTLWIAMAEAALRYAEYQANHPGAEAGDYFVEQCRLWDAFLAAHKAAKEVNKS